MSAQVPKPYSPTQAAGRALLWSISSACSRVSVNGGQARPGVVHFVGAEIAPPQDAAPNDIHSAVLWVATDRPDVRAALAAAGLPGVHLRMLRYSLTRGVALDAALLEAGSAYSIGSSSTPAQTHPHAHDAYWSAAGGRAVVHHAFSTERLSDCGITAAEAGRFATMLGTTSRATPCFLQTGVATTVDAARLM